MTLVYGLILPVISIVFLYLIYKAKKFKTKVIYVILLVLLILLYKKVQPSYIPKGDITRSDIPELVVPPDAVIEDRNRKPVPSEVRNKEQTEAYKNGLIFIEKD